MEKLRCRRQKQSPLRPRAFLLHKLPRTRSPSPPASHLQGYRWRVGSAGRSGGRRGSGGSLLVDSPSAGCGRSSIPKDPTHCPPGVGGKRVTFRREVKRQSTLPPITLRHKAQDFSSKGVSSTQFLNKKTPTCRGNKEHRSFWQNARSHFSRTHALEIVSVLSHLGVNTHPRSVVLLAL